MMRRRILLWMGFCLLFISFFHLREGQAQEANQIQTDSPFSSLSEQLDVTQEDQRSFTQRGDSSLNSESNPTASTKKSIKPQKSAKSKPKKNAIYTVKKGDTLARIAIKTRVSVAELRDLNHMKGNALQIGQILALQKEPNQGKMPLPTAEQATNALSGELEEEEDDGVSGIVTWAEIERKNKESSAPLDHWSTPEEPKLLVKVAMGFLGAPYRFGGSSVTGIDCSAFVKKIYQVFDITLPRTAYEQSHVGLRIGRSDLVEGDLLFFNTRRALGHVGIYIGNNEFVHASSRKRGVRIDNLSMPYFNKRFVRAVRLKGSNDGL
jgi:peptidoglycan endopeptidase LytE